MLWRERSRPRQPRAARRNDRRVARAIQQEAPHHLHTAHLAHEFACSAYFHQEPWLDVNMAYTYGAACLHVLPESQRQDPVRPVIPGETRYEAKPNALELLPDAKRGDLWTPYRIRRKAWWAVLSGAKGYCAGTRLGRFEMNWRNFCDPFTLSGLWQFKHLT